MSKPNILFIYTDQQRADTLHRSGSEFMITPNLDGLAKRGVLYTRAFCNSPVCMPSRHSMLTGRYPSTIGCATNGIELSPDIPNIADIFSKAGYTTASIGKLHFTNHADRDFSLPHPKYGFDTLILSDEPGCYDDDYIQWVREKDPEQVENCRCSTPPAFQGIPIVTHPRDTHEPYLFDGPEELTHSAFVAEKTIDYLKENREKPFMVMAGFYAPHPPLNPPERFVKMYETADIPLPDILDSENSLGLTMEDWRKVRQYYYALTTHADDQIGKILKTLEDQELRDNTIVVFTSDHGEYLGDRGMVQKGPPGYDSCIHIPLILSLPDNAAPAECNQIIEAVDILPTLLELCAIPEPIGIQGRSFAGSVLNKNFQARESAFIEYREPFGQSWKTLRTEKFKYCRSNGGTELLYDLINDSAERINLAKKDEYLQTLQECREQMLKRWFDIENQLPLKTAEY